MFAVVLGLLVAGCGGTGQTPKTAEVSKLAAHMHRVDRDAVKLKREAVALVTADRKHSGHRHRIAHVTARRRRELSAAAKSVARRPSTKAVDACVRHGRERFAGKRGGASVAQVARLVRRCLTSGKGSS